jgi:hypothetical protein
MISCHAPCVGGKTRGCHQETGYAPTLDFVLLQCCYDIGRASMGNGFFGSLRPDVNDMDIDLLITMANSVNFKALRYKASPVPAPEHFYNQLLIVHGKLSCKVRRHCYASRA